MILLDTNVIAEMMLAEPDPLVLHWFNEQERGSLYLSTVTVEEINFGLDLMSAGRRRDRLERAFSGIILVFRYNVLSVDSAAAVESAQFRARREQIGRPMAIPDALIAGVAKSKNLQLATLNTRDFEEIALEVIHPH